VYSCISFGMPFRFALFCTIPTSSFSTSYLFPNATFTIFTSLLISYVTMFTSPSFQIPLVKGFTSNPFFKIMATRITNFLKNCNFSSKFYDRDDMFWRNINKLQISFHYKLSISWNFNKMHVKIINQYFVQNLWASQCKNGTIFK
jgi:hypothetical protein